MSLFSTERSSAYVWCKPSQLPFVPKEDRVTSNELFYQYTTVSNCNQQNDDKNKKTPPPPAHTHTSPVPTTQMANPVELIWVDHFWPKGWPHKKRIVLRCCHCVGAHAHGGARGCQLRHSAHARSPAREYRKFGKLPFKKSFCIKIHWIFVTFLLVLCVTHCLVDSA